jgi:hypothetical protein
VPDLDGELVPAAGLDLDPVRVALQRGVLGAPRPAASDSGWTRTRRAAAWGRLPTTAKGMAVRARPS